MPIRNRNLDRASRKRVFTWRVDLDGAADTPGVLVDPENDIEVKRVDIVYSKATNDGTVDNVLVGTAADDDHYVAFTPVASKDLGTVAAATLLNTTLLSAGTSLHVTRAGTSGNNTGEVTVVVHYELVDSTSGFQM